MQRAAYQAMNDLFSAVVPRGLTPAIRVLNGDAFLEVQNCEHKPVAAVPIHSRYDVAVSELQSLLDSMHLL